MVATAIYSVTMVLSVDVIIIIMQSCLVQRMTESIDVLTDCFHFNHDSFGYKVHLQ